MTFEEYAKKEGFNLNTDEQGLYYSTSTAVLFKAWQASREATINECANICKNLAANYDWPSCCAAEDCENAILEPKDKNEI